MLVGRPDNRRRCCVHFRSWLRGGGFCFRRGLAIEPQCDREGQRRAHVVAGTAHHPVVVPEGTRDVESARHVCIVIATEDHVRDAIFRRDHRFMDTEFQPAPNDARGTRGHVVHANRCADLTPLRCREGRARSGHHHERDDQRMDSPLRHGLRRTSVSDVREAYRMRFARAVGERRSERAWR